MSQSSASNVDLSAPELPVRRVGKYQILSELGRGGMSNVYLAVAQGPGGIDKLVVLKALLPELSSEADALAMFLDEARLAARLNHANVVQTYEVGTEGDRHVIVMEYLDGQSLSSILKRGEATGDPLQTAMFLRILINALEGLHYAHELNGYDGTPIGLVHRDVSPQNIFVTYDGQVKVLDFGIAKAATSSIHTATGVVKGKIAYMAPEQMVAEAIDRRADVYSVGCVLWAAATGKKLWKDTPDVHIMRRVINGEVSSPQSFNPACPDELNRIVMKALAANVNERYATALELQADLEAYVESIGAPIKQKHIGAYLSKLFAEPRAELKALIDRQLTLIASDSASRAEEYSRSAVRNSPTLAVPNYTTTVESPTVTGSTPEPARKSNKLVYGAVLLLLLLVTGFALKQRGAPPAGAHEATTPLPPVAPAQAALPAQVTLTFSAKPATATLYLDGAPLSGNPATSTLARDEKTHRVRAEAAGYLTEELAFTPSRDDNMELTLQAAPSDTHGGSASPRTGKRAAVTALKAPAAAAPVKPAAAPAKSSAACAQPFFIDSDGIKKFRPECM